MLSVALQGLRGRKAPFIGAFVALAVASALVMACGMLLQAGLRSKAPVERYAAAPVVVAGDQNAHINVGTNNADTVPLLERARVDASIVPLVARLPGVDRAIADVSVPVDVLGPRGAVEGPGGHPVALHPWQTAVLTPYSLDRGRPPLRDDEIVVDAGLAARGHLTVGQKVRLSSTAPVQGVVVVGIVRTSVEVERQGVVFSTAATAARLSGLRRVDAVAILPRAGVDQKMLVEKVTAVLHGRARVVTGAARGDVEHIENIEAREGVTAIGATFGGLSLFIAMFVVASTIGLSVLQREREVALLRAVAATPKQVRRMIRWETLVLALVASVVGALPGAVFADVLGGALADRGVAPEDMQVGFALIPFAVAVTSSVLAALVAVA